MKINMQQWGALWMALQAAIILLSTLVNKSEQVVNLNLNDIRPHFPLSWIQFFAHLCYFCALTGHDSRNGKADLQFRHFTGMKSIIEANGITKGHLPFKMARAPKCRRQ